MSKYYFLLIIVAISCEKEITIDPGNFIPELVVNCILDTDTTFLVNVSHTSIMTDTTTALVENATVEIWMDNILLENLYNIGNGIYKSDLNKPISGHTYQIKASAPGFNGVTAYDTIPPNVPLTDAYYIFHMGTDVNHPSNADVFIEFQDPGSQENYYELILYTKSTMYNYYEENDSVLLINYYSDFQTSDPILISEGDLDYKPSTIYFSDKLFNGKTVTASLTIETRNYGLHNGVYDYQGQFKIAEFRSISSTYYQYLKKWTKHLHNQGIDLNISADGNYQDFLFSGEPVNMYSNVQNGYGIFAGYSKSKYVMRKID